MDLSPFQKINPCGYPGLQVTQLNNEGCTLDTKSAFDALLPYLMKHLDYTEVVTDDARAELLNTSRAA
jgi:lipoyl(octanoyl) transferase